MVSLSRISRHTAVLVTEARRSSFAGDKEGVALKIQDATSRFI